MAEEITVNSMYDISMRGITKTKEQVELLIKELSLNIQNLMHQKFAYADLINNAETHEALDAIVFEFVMTDFSASIE